MRTAALTIPLLCISIASTPLWPQTGVQKPAFEVASVKIFIPSTGGEPVMFGFHIQPGGRFTSTNVTLKQLLTYAYHVSDYQIVGEPNWISSDRWEITAKAQEGALPTQMDRRRI